MVYDVNKMLNLHSMKHWFVGPIIIDRGSLILKLNFQIFCILESVLDTVILSN